MADTPKSMDEVAALMKDNLPTNMSPSEFGREIGWGRGSEEARARMGTLTTEELKRIGLTEEQAINWATAFEAVGKLMPQNPSAAGRSELMRHAERLLSGG